VTTRENDALHHPQQLHLDRMKTRLAYLKVARADVERQGFGPAILDQYDHDIFWQALGAVQEPEADVPSLLTTQEAPP
jgi:hypothetical protein